jgi:hypothetical protein
LIGYYKRGGRKIRRGGGGKKYTKLEDLHI